jgi:hypothetical protein
MLRLFRAQSLEITQEAGGMEIFVARIPVVKNNKACVKSILLFVKPNKCGIE